MSKILSGLFVALRFVVWLILGMVIYVFYSRKRSEFAR